MPKRERALLPRSPNSAMTDRQLTEGVADPGVNDVICGRGDTINRHPGNVQFRKLVDEKRRVYLSSHFKREKRLIAETIVAAVKALDPPGRFLSKDPRTGLWFTVDEDRAREKASQALREGSKRIRAEIQQKDQQRKREAEKAANHLVGVQPDVGGNKSAQFDPHHYPYGQPGGPGPGWGLPYYYGYSPHQVPPYPPTYPPQGYPQQHSNGTMQPTAYGYTEGYPNVPPYGTTSQGCDVHPDRHAVKSLHAKRPQHDEIKSVQDDGSPIGNMKSREEDHRSRASLKCRRLESHHHERTSAPTDHSPIHISPPFKFTSTSPEGSDPGSPPGPGGHPGKSPANGATEGTTPAKAGFPLPPPFLSFKSPQPDAGSSGRPIQNHRQHNSGHSQNNNNGLMPINTNYKYAHSYTSKSPLSNNFGRGSMGAGSNNAHHNPEVATLTPSGANCMAALDEILGGASPMGYTPPQPSPLAATAATPPNSGTSIKDPAVPFSPIRAHIMHNTGQAPGACPHPNLQPRPFYR